MVFPVAGDSGLGDLGRAWAGPQNLSRLVGELMASPWVFGTSVLVWAARHAPQAGALISEYRRSAPGFRVL